MDFLRKRTKMVGILFLFAVLLLLPARETQAATNMVSQAKKNKITSGKFVETKKGKRYKRKNGKYVSGQWASIGGKIYYFNNKGYVQTGWFVYQKKTYYAPASGTVYYSKWLTLKGKKYYLQKNGVRASKTWLKKNGSYYYFNASGVMLKSQQVSYGGKYYYVGADGTRKTNCWVTQKKKRYFFGKDGTRYQGKWVKYKGKFYYLQKKTGVMATDCWVGDYYVGSDGARKVSCYVGEYYLDSTGKKVKTINFKGKYLMVGDSRTVGMDSVVTSKDTAFVGEISMGYSWLTATAGPVVKRYLAGNPKLKVVFGFGINDLGNISQYISYYRSFMKKYPDAEFYFLSVNPVNETLAASNGYLVKNSEIQAFNAKMKSAFGAKYIDTYTWLSNEGFSSWDGVHYTGETYRKLYDYLIKKIA